VFSTVAVVVIVSFVRYVAFSVFVTVKTASPESSASAACSLVAFVGSDSSLVLAESGSSLAFSSVACGSEVSLLQPASEARPSVTVVRNSRRRITVSS
jgi:hypothetical protein